MKDKPFSFRNIVEKAVNWMELVGKLYSATKQYHIKLFKFSAQWEEQILSEISVCILDICIFLLYLISL